MNRQYYLDLAKTGTALPVAAHLELHGHSDYIEIANNGRRLGEVIEKTCERYDMPVAIPLMDLAIEKSAILAALNIPQEQHGTYHFTVGPSDKEIEQVKKILDKSIAAQMQVTCDALTYIDQETDLLPVGMCIGAFSLMTKLLADPITPVFMFGSGSTANDDPDVARMLSCLEISVVVISAYVRAQAKAGAKAMFMCEPAANNVYLSPNQLGGELDVFDRLVIESDRRIKEILDECGVDLILHDCGELTDSMVKKLASLNPVILSLGSSRILWEDAKLVPDSIVLYGNLPSKHFYSDEKTPNEEVMRKSTELVNKMKQTGHPFILGTECDVLSVEGSEERLREKVDIIAKIARKNRN